MPTTCDLTQQKCVPCEGGIPPLSPDQVSAYLAQCPAWSLTEDAQRIRREWWVKDFNAALAFFKRVGELAEQEGHHPDLHLVAYRNVIIELWTHAVNGLTENDFILAAKIDGLAI